MRIRLLLLFILLLIVNFAILNYEKEQKIIKHLSGKSDLINRLYEVHYHHYKQESKTLFELLLKQDDIINIYKKLQSANEDQKNILREELYRSLADDYNKMEFIKLKQLHFHLKNNVSFLRMHSPKKFGDDLSNIRETVNYVNTDHKTIDGFEMGRVYSGLRFLYPILDENKNHLGSVEVSFDISVFSMEFMEHFNLLTNFHLKKSVVDKKAWQESIKENYQLSPIEGYYLENKNTSVLKEYAKKLNLPIFVKSDLLVQEALKWVNENKTISLYDSPSGTVVTFLPVTNSITKEVTAFFSIRGVDSYITNKTNNMYMIFYISSLLLAIIFYLVAKAFLDKEKTNKYLQEKIAQETEELSVSNEKLKLFKKVIDSVKSGVSITKYDDKLDSHLTVYVNDTFEKITGYSFEDIKNKNMKILQNKDFDQPEISIIKKAIAEGKDCETVLRNYKKDGTLFYNQVKLAPIFDMEGKVTHYIGIQNDVTEKIKQDRRVIQQKNFLDTLLQKAPIPIFYKNIRGEYIGANKKWYEMTGFDEKEVIGKNVFDLYYNLDEKLANLYYEQDLKILEGKEESVVVKSYYLNVKTKKNYDVMMYKTPFYNENNQLSGLIGSIVDITELSKLQDEKIKQEKTILQQAKLAEMGEMLENIAHQWRQPLSIISTCVTGMELKKEMDILDDKEFFELCAFINEQAQYLSKIIDDFRSLLHGESEAVNFNLKNDTDIFIKFINSIIEKYNIQLIIDLEENINIHGYPKKLIQCFINIFNNAKDAFVQNQINEDQRYLFLSQYTKEDKVIIEIKDSAGGIDEHIIDKIFEPYFTTKHQSQGTGLGLDMTYKFIVNIMKGNIEVSNETYNFNGKEYTGAKFRIELPLNS